MESASEHFLGIPSLNTLKLFSSRLLTITTNRDDQSSGNRKLWLVKHIIPILQLIMRTEDTYGCEIFLSIDNFVVSVQSLASRTQGQELKHTNSRTMVFRCQIVVQLGCIQEVQSAIYGVALTKTCIACLGSCLRLCLSFHYDCHHTENSQMIKGTNGWLPSHSSPIFFASGCLYDNCFQNVLVNLDRKWRTYSDTRSFGLVWSLFRHRARGEKQNSLQTKFELLTKLTVFHIASKHVPCVWLPQAMHENIFLVKVKHVLVVPHFCTRCNNSTFLECVTIHKAASGENCTGRPSAVTFDLFTANHAHPFV